MSIPTYLQALGDDQLGSSISIVHGGDIFDDVSSDQADENSLSIATINAQLKKTSRDSIEFIPTNSIEDQPFEVFKKNQQNSPK